MRVCLSVCVCVSVCVSVSVFLAKFILFFRRSSYCPSESEIADYRLSFRIQPVVNQKLLIIDFLSVFNQW